MLDPWIIEEIKRREESRDEGRRLEIPLEKPLDDRSTTVDDGGEDRGVTVIDL